MSEHISKCCGWGVHVGGERTTHFYVCDQCMKACDVETIEQRDHRMRVEGAMAALDSDWSEFPAADMSITSEAERLVAEHEKEGKHGSA